MSNCADCNVFQKFSGLEAKVQVLLVVITLAGLSVTSFSFAAWQSAEGAQHAVEKHIIGNKAQLKTIALRLDRIELGGK